MKPRQKKISNAIQLKKKALQIEEVFVQINNQNWILEEDDKPKYSNIESQEKIKL